LSEPLHILGGGSLGLLWAARFARAGIDCRLILRTPEAAARWRAGHHQLVLEQGNRLQSYSVPAETAEADEPISRLIVATKAWAVAEALEGIAPRLHAGSQLLLLQNGLGSQQAASERFADLPVLYASVTDGAWKRANNHVVWAGSGQTQVGDPQQRPQPGWLSMLDQAGVDWQWQPDILSVLWMKLAVNCAINPLTVLHDCPNGDVLRHAADDFIPLVQELQALLASQGVAVGAAELEQRIRGVIQATAANSSSMRQDVQAGRRTEIDFILGHAWRSARSAGLLTPVLDSLYHRLQTHLHQSGLPLN